jgi:HAD superfamily hydrolase (TIGR01549 family)
MIDQLPEHIRTLFLDMNGTFMFGHDRLGEDEDFYPAYLNQGGNNMASDLLNASVRKVIARLDELYFSGSHDSDFPQVLAIAAEVLSGDACAEDMARVERIIAAHEIGEVSDLNAATLTALSKGFKLFVVSNLWSRGTPWREYLDTRLGASPFSGLIFSSDIAVNKPAPEMFEHALRLAATDPGNVAMVGDDLARDIRPAAALGMTTIWVSDTATNRSVADHVIAEFHQLYSPRSTL